MPGFARAIATSSFTVFAGTDGCTTMTLAVVLTSDTGEKSFTGSYGSFA